MSKQTGSETGARPVGPGLLPLKVRKVRTSVSRSGSEWTASSEFRLPDRVSGWRSIEYLIGQTVTAVASGVTGLREVDRDLLIESTFDDPPPGGVPLDALATYLRAELPPLLERAFQSRGKAITAEAAFESAVAGRPWLVRVVLTFARRPDDTRDKDQGPVGHLPAKVLIAHSLRESRRWDILPSDQPGADRLLAAAEELAREYFAAARPPRPDEAHLFLVELSLRDQRSTEDGFEMACWSVHDLCERLLRDARADEGTAHVLADEYVMIRVTYALVTYPGRRGSIDRVQPPVDQPSRAERGEDQGRLVMPAPAAGEAGVGPANDAAHRSGELETLLRATESKSPSVRQVAASLIGAERTDVPELYQATVSRLMTLLLDDADEVRGAACGSLLSWGARDPRLAERLEGVAVLFGRHVGRSADATEELKPQLPGDREVSQAFERDHADLTAALTLAQSHSEQDRINAAQVLADATSDRAEANAAIIPALASLLVDQSPRVIRVACEALYKRSRSDPDLAGRMASMTATLTDLRPETEPLTLESLRGRMRKAVEMSGLSKAEIGRRVGRDLKNPGQEIHKLMTVSGNPGVFTLQDFAQAVGLKGVEQLLDLAPNPLEQ